jgi:hypothetical protein
MTLSTAILIFFVTSVSLLTSSCGTDSDAFYYAALGLNKGAIIVASNTGVTSYIVVKYSIEGEFEQVLYDSTTLGLIPRGLALYDAFNILVNFDGVDSISKLNIFSGSVSSFHTGALYNGNLFHIAHQGDVTYAIESNNIERFNGSDRFPSSGNAYIPTTLGLCTINTARGVAINNAGELLVASLTNTRILRYNVSTTTPTCLTSNASFGTNQPIAIMSHSNGKLYFATQTTADSIFSGPENLSSTPTALVTNGIINNPSALAEMPDGSILVANDGTYNIDLIDPDTGATIQSPFIKDSFTSFVTDIMVIQPQ